MPFFDARPDTVIEIDYDKYDPIAVISYTDNNGKITPLQLKRELPDQTRVTVKIDSIRQTKDIPGGVLYSCVSVNGRQKSIFDIIFYYQQCMWVIRKDR